MRNSTTGSILGLAILAVIFAGSAAAQNGRSAAATRPKATANHIGMVQDWSQQAVIFSNPDTPEEARSKNRMARWNRFAADPRFQQSLLRKLEAQSERAARRSSNARPRPNPIPGPSPSPTPSADGSIHRDWSNVVGGLSGSGSAGIYPSKYSFDIYATPSCVNDFIVYPTAAAGATSSGTSEFRNGTFTQRPNSNQTITLGTGSRSVTLTAVDTVTNNRQFARGPNTTNSTEAQTNATNLTAAVKAWAGQTGIDATNLGGGVVRFTRISTGDDPGNLPITNGLSSLSIPAVAGGTTGSGTAGQPTIIAFNQLYNTTCNATRSNSNAPNVFWSYNTGDGRIAETSPVISYSDGGKQVAFIQRNTASATDELELVLLKWKSGDGSAAAPATPATAASATDYRNGTGACAGGVACMMVFDLSGTSNTDGAATFSSPFVDYFGDVLWVGDGNSRLHKFTGVFKGAPAEVTSSGFPSAVSATAGLKLSSPVYDFTSSVFIGSQSLGAGVGGALHRVSASNGASVVSSGKLSADNNSGVRAWPMLDVTTAHVFAFVSRDNSDACSGGTGNDCQAVYQFATNFGAGTTGVRGSLGAGFDSVPTYNGGFDYDYFSSPTHDGAFYTCGSTTTSNSTMVLYRVPLTGGLMGTPEQGGTVGTGTSGSCSPVSYIKNSGNEYLYVSVPDNGSAAGCTGACVYMYNLADLQTAAFESWTFEFTASQVTTGGTFVVNGVTFTAVNGTTSCNSSGGTFHVVQADGANGDGLRLRTCLTGNVPGFSVSGTGSQVILTRTIPGNVADNLVAEGVDMNNFSLQSHVDGNGGATAWEPTNVARAGLAAPGGTTGFVIDNISTNAGTSQVYYSQLTNPGNAIQASQAGLQ